MIEADRIISAAEIGEEDLLDRAIRPKLLKDYVGQEAVREQMDIFIQAARLRKDALDHLLILDHQAWVKLRWRILLPMKWG